MGKGGARIALGVHLAGMGEIRHNFLPSAAFYVLHLFAALA